MGPDVRRLWCICAEGIRFGFACRQRARGFPWTILPIPPAAWVKWRLDTAYGENRPRPPWRMMLHDVCVFLLWRRKMRVWRESPRMITR